MSHYLLIIIFVDSVIIILPTCITLHSFLFRGTGYSPIPSRYIRIIIILSVIIIVVSRASAHAHVPHFKGSLLYKCMEVISRVSRPCRPCRPKSLLCLSAHGRLPGTLRYFHYLTRMKQLMSTLLTIHILQCDL